MIIGGIRRIGAVAGAITPIMAGIYILAALWVLWVHADEIPNAFNTIFNQPLTPGRPRVAFSGLWRRVSDEGYSPTKLGWDRLR
ncbi:MAG: alanine:cation symporter family protein [Pseudanabaenales cyanobacterium]|nr:alanine:cation symporter family protein [Pseudanabaenales cyanobacterium]